MTTLTTTPRTLPHDRAIGIEVECLVSNPLSYYTHYGFFFAGRDASIEYSYSHSRPVEFVSQPLTQEWMKRELTKLYKKFEIAHNDSCGIHIHVNRGWCSGRRAERIAKFLATLSDEDMLLLFGRKPNDYCENTYDETGQDKYHAVNVCNSKTVEFRSFRSGSCQWAKYCVDLVCYLVKNVSTLNVDSMMAFRDLYPKEM